MPYFWLAYLLTNCHSENPQNLCLNEGYNKNETAKQQKPASHKRSTNYIPLNLFILKGYTAFCYCCSLFICFYKYNPQTS